MKTDLTKQIEKKLAERFMKTSERFAFEVSLSNRNKGYGIVDFMTCYNSYYERFGIPLFSCYEIKISISDFKSKNGHNMLGDKNYYVTTEEVYNWIVENEKMNYDYGYIVFKNDKLITKKEAVLTIRDVPDIAWRFKALDEMMIKWQSGTMYRIMIELGINLRNLGGINSV